MGAVVFQAGRCDDGIDGLLDLGMYQRIEKTPDVQLGDVEVHGAIVAQTITI